MSLQIHSKGGSSVLQESLMPPPRLDSTISNIISLPCSLGKLCSTKPASCSGARCSCCLCPAHLHPFLHFFSHLFARCWLLLRPALTCFPVVLIIPQCSSPDTWHSFILSLALCLTVFERQLEEDRDFACPVACSLELGHCLTLSS